MKENLLMSLGEILLLPSIKEKTKEVYQIRQQLRELGLTNAEDLDITNKIKSKVQLEANTAIDTANGIGAVIMATGTGKSKIAIDRCLNIVANKKDTKILLVVPTEKLRDNNWKDEFIKWNQKSIWSINIIPICYASIAKLEFCHFDLVIFDEGHNISENNSKFLEKNYIKSCILLTATIPKDEIKLNILDKFKIKIVYEINLDEAVLLGLIAPYDINIIYMSLDSINKNIKAGSKTRVFYQTEKQQYNYLTNIVNSKKTKTTIFNRLHFLCNLKSKTDIAKLILKNVIPDNLRTIIFCGSIAQAETLGPHTFHSKGDDRYFNLFVKKIINRLFCVNALNEGHNIPDLDCAFMVQLDSNELNLIQKIGRTVRFRPGHRAKIIILCVRDTVDENWVKKAIASLDVSKIKTFELSHLRMGIEKINFN